LCVNFQLTNNCFYSDLYEKNDSAKLAIPFTYPLFQEGKRKATFAHVASKLPFCNRTKVGQRGPLGSKKGPYQRGPQAQNPIRDRLIKNFDGSKFDSSAKAIKYTISINLQPYFTIHIQLTY
jgi:hypothetical protein